MSYCLIPLLFLGWFGIVYWIISSVFKNSICGKEEVANFPVVDIVVILGENIEFTVNLVVLQN